jgi:hypothetical protein
MNKSESIASLSKALVMAQAEFKSVQMNSVNPFFKSKYADLGAVIETCKPVLSKHGLAVSQLVEGEDGQAGVTTMLLHESGEFISTSLIVPISGSNISQEAGKTITYLRRYGLAAILGLYADEDNDSEGSHKDTSAGAKQEVKQDEMVDYLSGKVVSLFAKERGLENKDAVTAINELLTAGKIQKKMAYSEFEKVAHV